MQGISVTTLQKVTGVLLKVRSSGQKAMLSERFSSFLQLSSSLIELLLVY